MSSHLAGVPALVVSGFLGSGKTTLVRHLLRQAQESGRRVAVVSNEFGALGVDRALLGEGGEAYVELEGGCVCCQLSSELIDTLEMLRERVDPDEVIIETSGVAMPFDTQLSLWREPVSTWVEDDVAVVVIDAVQVWEERELEGTFEDQVTSADLLVLNKTDLVPAGALPEIEARVRAREPEAPIIRSLFSAVDRALLFPPDPRGLRVTRRRTPGKPTEHRHDAFAARELVLESGLGDEQVVARVRAAGGLRAKGFVRTRDGLRLVQGVGSRIELAKTSSTPDEGAIGRVVVISRDQPNSSP